MAVLAFGILDLSAQAFVHANNSNPNNNLYPMMSDQTYSVVMNVTGSKVEMMNTMKDLLIKFNYGDKENLDTISIDENMNEFHFPILGMQGQTLLKGPMGAKMAACPVILKEDLVFNFDDNDPEHVSMTITNFEGIVFCEADDLHAIGTYKKSLATDKGYGNYELNQYDQKIVDEKNTLFISGSFISRFLIISQTGADSYLAAMEEFRKKQKDQFDMYMDAVKYGSTEIITKDNIGGYANRAFTGKSEQFWLDMREHYESGEWVLGMCKYRWENGFQQYFDELFVLSANALKSSIQSVSLNDEILYEEFEGKLLPVNPKERKKWIKKGYTFPHYDDN